MNSALPSYKLAIKELEDSLKEISEYSYLIALSILSFIVKVSQVEILRNMNKHLNVSQHLTLKTIIRKLNLQYPVSYLLNNNNFYGLNFLVNKATLIPRPETELIVSLILDYLNINNSKQPLTLLEIGTGTGCIPISILANTEQPLNIYSVDVSTSALSIAKENVKSLLSKEKSGQIILSLKNILKRDLSGKFDIIVSNPPYISKDEYEQLNPSLFFEPKIALTDDSDGLTFYRKFVDLINTNLSPGGVCFFEIHSTSANKIKKIFSKGVSRKYKSIIHKDIYQRDRVIEIRSI